MAEAIINGLGQVNNLKVIARSSSFQFKGKNESLLAIGKLLNVATALEGSVTKSGKRIRVRATLTKTEDGTQLWSETFDRDLNDYLLIQDEITSKIVSALKISFSGQLRPSQRLSTNEEAMKLYQKGRYFHDKNGDGDQKRAAAYFAKAVKADSNFAMAWAYLGTTSDEEVSKFEKYTQKALELDPNLADALLGAAGVAWSNFNFAKGESDMRKALSLDKENPRILRNTGRVLGYLGYYDEGLELCKKAVEIDPLQAWSYLALTHAWTVNGKFADALLTWQKENEISNRNGLSTRAHLLVLNEQPKEALVLIDKIHDEEDKLFLLTAISFSLDLKDKSEEYFQKFKSTNGASNPHAVGELLCFFGRKKEAILMLENVKLTPILHWPPPDQWFRFWLLFRGSPYLIPLRDDPKFKEICKKLGYPDLR